MLREVTGNMNKKTIYLAMVVISSIASAEEINHRFDADFSLGYDDNPFKLSDTLNTQSSSFYEIDLQLTNRRNETGIYYRLNADVTDYLATLADDADKTALNAELGWRWRPMVNDERADYNFSIDFNSVDSTYYLRNTGDIATFRGELIGDRYDATWVDLRSRGKYPLSETTAITYDVRYRDKAYDDYTAVGLSNLDYSELLLQSGLDMKFKSGWRWQPAIEWSGREFDNKEIPDALGVLIENTNLEFDYVRVLNDLFVDLSDTVDLKIGYDWKQRQDNGFGYYDNTESNFNVRIRYREEPHEFAFYAAYVDRTFDNRTTNASTELDEENKSRKGTALKIRYEYNMQAYTDLEVKLLAEFRYGDYDNSDPFYIYQRAETFFGLEGRF